MNERRIRRSNGFTAVDEPPVALLTEHLARFALGLLLGCGTKLTEMLHVSLLPQHGVALATGLCLSPRRGCVLLSGWRKADLPLHQRGGRAAATALLDQCVPRLFTQS
jgi:hypothetical protein